MSGQKEHDKPENLVESPHQTAHEARTLEDEVDSNATLEGYFAMNNVRDGEEKRALALEEKANAAAAESEKQSKD